MFEAFSTGNYTLTTLTEFINERGLTMRPTAKYPDGRPVSRTTTHKMLRNPYYAGFVVWGGAQYPGRQAIVSLDLFQRVQDVLDGKGRRSGGWKHEHYLKGTVYCTCESRLGYTVVRGKGGEYEYFYCLGRQQGSGCETPYLPVRFVEQAVAEYYHRVQLTPERARYLGERLVGHFSRVREAAAREAVRHRARISKLKRSQEKLLEAFTEDAIDIDLMRRKQKELVAAIGDAERHLQEEAAVTDRIESSTERILKQAQECQASYAAAADPQRRILNQFWFERIFLSVDGAQGAKLTPLMEDVLAEDLLDRLDAELQSVDGANRSDGQPPADGWADGDLLAEIGWGIEEPASSEAGSNLSLLVG